MFSLSFSPRGKKIHRQIQSTSGQLPAVPPSLTVSERPDGEAVEGVHAEDPVEGAQVEDLQRTVFIGGSFTPTSVQGDGCSEKADVASTQREPAEDCGIKKLSEG